MPAAPFAVPAPFAVQTPVNVPLVDCDPEVMDAVLRLETEVVPLSEAFAMFA